MKIKIEDIDNKIKTIEALQWEVQIAEEYDHEYFVTLQDELMYYKRLQAYLKNLNYTIEMMSLQKFSYDFKQEIKDRLLTGKIFTEDEEVEIDGI